jgi:hypothetical protein
MSIAGVSCLAMIATDLDLIVSALGNVGKLSVRGLVVYPDTELAVSPAPID